MREEQTPGNGEPLEIAFDCRYFLGDRPCIWHKREGVHCTCRHYRRIEERLLIIKLDAMGDVLRTTALLPALAEAHPRAGVTWITRPESMPLLAHNPLVTETIPYGADALVALSSRTFDRVINLDAGAVSAGLAALAKSPRKDGYVLHERGHVVPINEAARRWLEMGISDDLKRRNTRTYQDVMSEILRLGTAGQDYVFCLTEDERREAASHLVRLGVDLSLPIVGLNSGAGGRWPLKQWREAGFLEVMRRFQERQGVQFLLLGGPAERDRNARLLAAANGQVFDAGADNPVRHFAALIDRCHAVVTGDTLAMHLALALRRRVVVLFGPTSAAEIELYGRGEKVLPRMDCLGCYLNACDKVPNCMDLITADSVARALARQLEAAEPAHQPHPPPGARMGAATTSL